MDNLEKEIVKLQKQRDRSMETVVKACKHYLKEIKPKEYLIPAQG